MLAIFMVERTVLVSERKRLYPLRDFQEDFIWRFDNERMLIKQLHS